jgi:membrane-associated protease RseP (regulator of RpoE activity)
MAESMRKILARKEYRGYKGVIIAGSLHVAYGLGIPFRFKRASGRSKILTVMPVLIPPEDEAAEEEEHPMKKMFAKNLPPVAVFSRGIGDYIFSVTQSDPPHFPELGLTCKKINDAIRITAIKKKSLAEKSGLKKGDIITGADGKNLDSLEQLRRLLAEKEWGDFIRFQLDRKIELKKEDDRLP